MPTEMFRFSPPASPSDNVQPGKNSMHLYQCLRLISTIFHFVDMFIGERNRRKPPTKKVTKKLYHTSRPRHEGDSSSQLKS